ncbi:MAG TPA: hypothetical protein VHE33_17000 [Acidobacteriaceae bacterium]|nr:hypothetical protein [Acidobacteriaceae bacterium]
MKGALQVLLIVGLAVGTVWAAENPFAGRWKMDPSKSTMVDEMKVASAGGNQYSFDFGGGTGEKIKVDGTDQPGMFGTTLAVTAEAPDRWKVVRKKDGRTMLIGKWTLSADGRTLTDDYTELDAKGSPATHLLYKYERMGGGLGFSGDWVSSSQPTDTVVVEIAVWEGDGLALTRRSVTRHVKFDGKAYPAEGANLPAGYGTSGRRVDARTVELTDKIGDKARDSQTMTVSEDGKTLTMRMTPVGRARPSVMVFERE